jgi:diaminohydroxyphosphoribosylaminopyrimidine deaminase/5-amino-6-(5-phosphoribosylamino)uracil reductase
MFVTLEPCCHHGKTGPCADAIVAARIGRVVVAVVDPAEYVAGKGIDRLREAGIAVEVGVCGSEAARLNAPFFKFAKTGLPWIILKWAQSRDGFCARKKTDDTKWISNPQSRRDAHRIRRRCQAILVGVNTIIEDDPLLTPRPSMDKRPLRIILDSRLRIPVSSRVLDTAKFSTLIVTTRQGMKNHTAEEAIHNKGAEILERTNAQDQCDIRALLVELGKRKIQQLLVEGGPTILDRFIRSNLADAVRVYIAPMVLGKGGIAPISNCTKELANPANLYDAKIIRFEKDECIDGMIRPMES